MMTLAADAAAARSLASVRRSSAAFHMTIDVTRIAVASSSASAANIQLGAKRNAGVFWLVGGSARGGGSWGGSVAQKLVASGELWVRTGLAEAARGRLRSPGRRRRALLWLLDKVKADHLPGCVGIGGPMQVEAQSVCLVDGAGSGGVGRGGNESDDHDG